MTTVYAKVQMRRDTAANWAAANPVLAEGEVGYIIDTKAEKIGDGVTAWNDLLSRPSLEQLTDVQNAAETAAADADQRLTATVAAQTATETARDETQTLRDQTYGYKQDVASAIVYQDLASIAEQKALTMVAGCVYDTRLDTDGGAWRERCQGTSWYNEPLSTATRGSRREFPTVAVIIAEADKVTVFDGDDPALPVWMAFVAGSNNMAGLAGSGTQTVSAKNGIFCIGSTTYDVKVINFPADKGNRYGSTGITTDYRGNIAARNAGSDWGGSKFPNLPSRTVNSVAMTVLQDAPVDQATGLQVPTIAVATAGGVSVIKHDGTVIDFTNSNSGFTYSGSVALKPSGEITFSMGASASSNQVTYVFDRIPAADNLITYNSKNGSVLNAVAIYTLSSSLTSDFAPTPAQPFSSNQQFDHVDGAVATKVGLVSLLIDNSSPARSMFALATSTFLTGWLTGLVKGAFLASTDQTDLVESGELITNGTFDADVSGWTARDDGSTISWDATNARLALTNPPAGSRGYAYQTITTVVGQTYSVSWDWDGTGINSTGNLYVGTVAYSGNIVAKGGVQGTNTLTFTAVGTTTYITLCNNSTTGGATGHYDNISVQLADEDRSVKGNGLIVHGTVPRAPVATGAELVGYGPFSGSSYLQQPYNADLDFGVGDFCVMGWIKGNGQQCVLHRAQPAGTGGFLFEVTSSNALSVYLLDSTSWGLRLNSGTVPSDVWSLVTVTRQAGVLSTYINGKLVDDDGGANSALSFPSNGDESTRVGVRLNGAWPADNLALVRIGATAPSAAQIAKIYRDEKRLFQPGAQCTLYGTSDAVTALAHDPATGLLHAGTSAGRSDFDGLLRVGNTTTPVAKAIAASGGMILEG